MLLVLLTISIPLTRTVISVLHNKPNKTELIGFIWLVLFASIASFEISQRIHSFYDHLQQMLSFSLPLLFSTIILIDQIALIITNYATKHKKKSKFDDYPNLSFLVSYYASYYLITLLFSISADIFNLTN
jgi:hypothetical protein